MLRRSVASFLATLSLGGDDGRHAIIAVTGALPCHVNRWTLPASLPWEKKNKPQQVASLPTQLQGSEGHGSSGVARILRDPTRCRISPEQGPNPVQQLAGANQGCELLNSLSRAGFGLMVGNGGHPPSSRSACPPWRSNRKETPFLGVRNRMGVTAAVGTAGATESGDVSPHCRREMS